MIIFRNHADCFGILELSLYMYFCRLKEGRFTGEELVYLTSLSSVVACAVHHFFLFAVNLIHIRIDNSCVLSWLQTSFFRAFKCGIY